MKDLYFAHDRNAMNDNKITDLRGMYGMEGYGVFWAVVEALSRSPELSLEYNNRKIAGLSVSIQPSFSMQEFIDFCIEIHLFETDGSTFWSNSLRRRMKSAKDVSEKKKAAARARWEKKNADAMHVHCTSNADALQDGCRKDAPCMRSAMQNENENENENEKMTSSSSMGGNVIDEEWKRVVLAYEDQLGVFPSGRAGDIMVSFFEDLGPEVMLYAIEIANNAQPAAPYKYLKAILDDFAKREIKTREAAEEYCAKRDKRRKQQEPVEKTPDNGETAVRWI